jgi:hypothetical protein
MHRYRQRRHGKARKTFNLGNVIEEECSLCLLHVPTHVWVGIWNACRLGMSGLEISVIFHDSIFLLFELLFSNSRPPMDFALKWIIGKVFSSQEKEKVQKPGGEKGPLLPELPFQIHFISDSRLRSQ